MIEAVQDDAQHFSLDDNQRLKVLFNTDFNLSQICEAHGLDINDIELKELTVIYVNDRPPFVKLEYALCRNRTIVIYFRLYEHITIDQAPLTDFEDMLLSDFWIDLP